MLGRGLWDRYDASSARSVPTQEELDYPQYFTSRSDAERSGQRGYWRGFEGLPKSDDIVDARGDSKSAFACL